MNDASRKGKIRGVIRRAAIRHLVQHADLEDVFAVNALILTFYINSVGLVTAKKPVFCGICQHIIQLNGSYPT